MIDNAEGVANKQTFYPFPRRRISDGASVLEQRYLLFYLSYLNNYFLLTKVVNLYKYICLQNTKNNFSGKLLSVFACRTSRESKIDVRFPVEVLARIWQQLKTDVSKNCFRKAGFRRNNETASEESSVLDDKPSDTSGWPQVREVFEADTFSQLSHLTTVLSTTLVDHVLIIYFFKFIFDLVFN